MAKMSMGRLVRRGHVKDEKSPGPPSPELTPEELLSRLAYFTHLVDCSTYRGSRLEELMGRRIAKGWAAAKKTKMVRRLSRARQEHQQSVAAIAELGDRLVKLGVDRSTQAMVVKRALATRHPR